MVTIGTVRKALPPFRNERILIKQRQGAEDIINEILVTHNDFASDYDNIYHYFYTGDCYTTAKKIWEFLKYNLIYNAESGKDQSVKSPAAILEPGEKVDCKHYSLFAGGILSAINRNENKTWSWFYRFASYDTEPIAGHVFVVLKCNNKEIWIDPVLTNFDQHKQPTYIEDFEPMALYKISGVNEQIANIVPVNGKTVEVDPYLAITNFLVALNMNLFSLKQLLLSDPGTTNGEFKNWFIKSGGNWDSLMAILRAPTI